MNPDRFDKLLGFIRRLEESQIHFEVASYRYDGISVVVTVPGERWEVDFLADGDIDVEKFVSNGQIEDESALEALFERFAEPREAAPQVANPNGAISR
jgi:hypothetical protein